MPTAAAVQSRADRARHARRYKKALIGIEDLILPCEADGTSHAWHVHAIRVAGQKELLRVFHSHGIGHGRHYPVPVHLQQAYRSAEYPKGSFPVSEQCADEFLSLPIGPELGASHIDEVIAAIAIWADAAGNIGYRDHMGITLQSHAKV